MVHRHFNHPAVSPLVELADTPWRHFSNQSSQWCWYWGGCAPAVRVQRHWVLFGVSGHGRWSAFWHRLQSLNAFTILYSIYIYIYIYIYIHMYIYIHTTILYDMCVIHVTQFLFFMPNNLRTHSHRSHHTIASRRRHRATGSAPWCSLCGTCPRPARWVASSEAWNAPWSAIDDAASNYTILQYYNTQNHFSMKHSHVADG